MTEDDKPTLVHTDSSEQHAPTEPVTECPTCGADEMDFDMGYGLAGGGVGPYIYCGRCGTVISKSQDGEV